MQFITENDLNGVIGSSTLAQLEGTAGENLDTAEQLAISELDPLRENYDIDGELSKADTNRNKMLVRILTHITVYYLYNTVEDVDIPERVNANYKNAINDIEKIAAGKKSTTLDALLDETTELPKTRYRFGGDDPRDNDIF